MENKASGKINTPYLIFGTVVILLIILFATFRIVHIKETIASIDQEEQAYKENTAKLNQLMLISKKEEEFKQAISTMNGLIPDQAEDYDIINKINNFSSILDTNFIQIEFADMVVNNNINVMPFSLSFKGQYLSLIQLISDISSGERLIRIDDIDISQNDSVANSINVEIKARAFYR